MLFWICIGKEIETSLKIRIWVPLRGLCVSRYTKIVTSTDCAENLSTGWFCDFTDFGNFAWRAPLRRSAYLKMITSHRLSWTSVCILGLPIKGVRISLLFEILHLRPPEIFKFPRLCEWRLGLLIEGIQEYSGMAWVPKMTRDLTDERQGSWNSPDGLCATVLNDTTDYVMQPNNDSARSALSRLAEQAQEGREAVPPQLVYIYIHIY